MAPPITEFVDVTIVVGGAVATKFSFGALMGVAEHNITANRQDGPFFSVAELNTAGFTSIAAPAINAWATAAFAQDDGVDQVLIGRRIPVAGGIAQQVWQVDSTGPTFVDETTGFNDATDANFTPFPAGNIANDYVAVGMPETFGQIIFDNLNGTAGTVGVVAWEYLSAPGVWTVLAGIVDGTTSFTAAVADGQTVTFTIPAGWAKQDLNGVSAFWVRAVVTTPFTVDPIYDQGFVGTDANLTVSLDAIELDDPESWYITNIIDGRTDAEIALVGTWHEARTKIAMVQSDDLTLVAALALQAANLTRTALWYHDDDTEYLDGAASSSGGGMNLDVEGGVGIWAHRSLEGVPFDDVTGAQALAIYAAGANLNGRNVGLSFTSKGTMAGGRFIDITTTGDWFQARLEEALVAAQVNANKIPFTNGGINQIRGVISGVATQGQSFGHFSTDVTPEIILPDISEVSTTDKANRELTAIVNVTLASAIQKVSITVNITL
jgi:hypothetical protein